MVKKTKKQEKKLDISNHILVPEHSKVSEKEKKELFEKYNLKQKDLPKILSSDAALLSLDIKAGDIVKITRKSPTAGKTCFYRGVIDG